MKQSFYLTVLGAAFLTAALISDVSDCNGAPPSGNHSRPSGASPRPSGPPSRPGGASSRPGGSSTRPGGAPSRPGGSSTRPGGSTMHPGGSPSRPGGHTTVQPRPGGRPGPSNDNHGGRVVRRVTSNTLTGEVIRDEYFGHTSPIHRGEPFDRPGIGPGYYPGGYHPGHNPPPPPPRPYYPSRPYPYYPNTYYPALPAYPPPPPGFPPPPEFWPGFIYNGLPILINANVNVIPNYPNIQQLGLFGVYDSYGNRSGSLLVYYNPRNSKLGGYFNPVGTKYTRSVQGVVSMVNGVQTAMFTVNDQYKTECAVPFSGLLAGATTSGTMLIPRQVLGDTPQASTFTLQRLQ